MLSTYQKVARIWWTGEWKHETNFNSQVLNEISANDGKLTDSLAQRIASKYRVARQFPKFCKTSNAKEAYEYAPIVERINATLPSLKATNLPTHVIEIAHELSLLRIVDKGGQQSVVPSGQKGRHFTKGGCVPISAVSKWIWFGRPEVGVIYDKEARDTMNQLGYSVPHGNYRAYVAAFGEVYDKRVDELEQALDGLGSERPVEKWASRKLLDLWLWYNSPSNTKDRGEGHC